MNIIPTMRRIRKMENFEKENAGENAFLESTPLNKYTAISHVVQQKNSPIAFQTSITQWDYILEFAEAMRLEGVLLKGDIIADGKLHRFKPEGNHNPDGWYVFSGFAGSFGDWKKGIKAKWKTHNPSLSIHQKQQLNREEEKATQAYQAEVARVNQQASERAVKDWDSFSDIGSSDYLNKKQVEGVGIKFGNGCIVMPIQDVHGKMWSYQKIYNNGEKRLLKGGIKKGCFHMLGHIENGQPAYVAEGYATGASVHMATGIPVIIAIDAGNIEAVVSDLKKKYPNSQITIAGDDDQWSDDGNNAGRQKAEDAAKKYGCHVVFPKFKEEHHKSEPTDWNDLHCLEGLNEVKSQICNKIKNLVAMVATNQKTNINQQLRIATSIATIATKDETALQLQYDHTNIFLVRTISESIKRDLTLLYPDYGLVEISEQLPIFHEKVKEIIIVSSTFSEEQKKRDRYFNRTLQRSGIATYTCYLPQNVTLTEELKSVIEQCKQQLQIPSSLTRMTNAQDLFKYNTKENDFLIQGLIPAVGVSILGGHPKTGKSWMALNFIRCLSRNELVFNEFYSQQVGIYYLSLEDNTSRLKSRLQKIYEEDNPEVSNLEIKTHIASSINGNYDFLDELRKEIESRPDIKLIIIDPFQKIRGTNDRKSDAYQADYKDMSALKDLADEFEISILLIHHLKKDKNLSEACLSSLNGSMGLSGAADSILLLTKENDTYSLKITGKDIEERTLVLTLDQESFIFSVAAEEQTMNKGLQDEILEILKNKGEPCQSKEIADRLGKNDANGQASVRNQIAKLKNKGLIRCVGRGFYSLSASHIATNSNLVAIEVAIKNSIKSTYSQPIATIATLNCYSEDEEYEDTDGFKL
jgi:phage/plasmid primase-like uncharacterized protein